MFATIETHTTQLKSGRGHFHTMAAPGEGAPLIHFAHANGYPFGSYADLLARLGDEFEIFGLAHRGCWEDHPGPEGHVQWQHYADDLIDFLERQQRGPVVGMGHSIGAVTTMFAAIKRPDLFSKLVLIDPVFIPPPLWYMSRLMKLVNKSVPMVEVAKRRPNHWPSREQGLEFHRGKRAFARFTPTALEAYGHFGIKATDKGFGLAFCRDWEAHIYSSVPYIWRQLPKVKQPLLGLRGADSDVISAKTWARWHKLRPQDKLLNLEQCGHLLPHERPEECALHIREFIR